jgi:mono/diheme cytochrome c family protein
MKKMMVKVIVTLVPAVIGYAIMVSVIDASAVPGDGEPPKAADTAKGADKPAEKAADPAKPADKPSKKSATGVDRKAVREGVTLLDADANGVGKVVADIELADAAGAKHRLSGHTDAKAIVITIVTNDCPMGKKIGPKIAALQTAYAGKPVVFFALDPAKDDTAEQIKAFSTTYGFTAPVLRDTEQKLAKALGAITTTDCFVLDAKLTLRYRGCFDDQFGIGVEHEDAKHKYLEDAVIAVNAGRPVIVEATTAPGCDLGLKPDSAAKPADKPAAAKAPTYYGEVAKIFNEHCIRCHRDGEAAPFALDNYDDASGNASMIRSVVRQGRMPPWFADPKTGSWQNDPRLTDAEKQTIFDWVAADAPAGDPKLAPKAPEFSKGWEIGKPDMVLKAGKPFAVKASGAIPYRNFVVDPKTTEDKWVSGYEIRATAPETVHHVLVFAIYPEDHPRAGEQPADFEGLNGNFAGMVPGQKAHWYPEGMGKFMPKGVKLRFQIHYTAVGKAVDCDISMGLKFTNGKPKTEIFTRGAFNMMFTIPAGAKRFPVTGTQKIQKDIMLMSLMPHMHVRGDGFEYIAETKETAADGTKTTKKETLLNVPVYDFNWQLVYRFKEPRLIKAGTTLRATGYFDNSTDNAANPDPTKAVSFGQQTWQDMMIGYYDYYEVPEAAEDAPAGAPAGEAPKADAPAKPGADAPKDLPKDAPSKDAPAGEKPAAPSEPADKPKAA